MLQTAHKKIKGSAKMIGIDVGFGYTKVSPKEIMFPSVFSEVTYASSLQNSGNLIDNMELELDGKTYLVGNKAQLENGSGSFSADNMLRHKICILTAIAITHGDFLGPVVLGLPVADMGRKKAMQELVGIYSIKLSGESYIIDITKINIVPQGAAAYFDLLLDDDGKIANDLGTKKIGLIDIGEKTVDFVCIDKNRFVNELSNSLNLGMNTAYLRLIKTIQSELGITTLPNKAKQYVDRVSTTGIEYRKLSAEILGNISAWWPSLNDFNAIYITGGGGDTLGKYFQEQIQCKVVKGGQFSNSRGYQKCGQMKK